MTALGAAEGQPNPVHFLYRDEHVVVVNKPSGVVVHATRGGIGRPLLQRVRDAVGRQVWLLHRLDAATSGAIALVTHPDLVGPVSASFGGPRVEKRYLALVRGVPPQEGTIDNPVPRAEGGPRVPAVSAFRRVWTQGRYSVVVVRPRTGRRHQVRRHLKHRSWPIIGDVNYGKGEHNRLFRTEYGLHRLALHAAVLAFPHPVGEAPLRVRCPLPPDLSEPFAVLGVPAAALEAALERDWPIPEAPRNEDKMDCKRREGRD